MYATGEHNADKHWVLFQLYQIRLTNQIIKMRAHTALCTWLHHRDSVWFFQRSHIFAIASKTFSNGFIKIFPVCVCVKLLIHARNSISMLVVWREIQKILLNFPGIKCKKNSYLSFFINIVRWLFAFRLVLSKATVCLQQYIGKHRVLLCTCIGIRGTFHYCKGWIKK